MNWELETWRSEEDVEVPLEEVEGEREKEEEGKREKGGIIRGNKVGRGRKGELVPTSRKGGEDRKLRYTKRQELLDYDMNCAKK